MHVRCNQKQKAFTALEVKFNSHEHKPHSVYGLGLPPFAPVGKLYGSGNEQACDRSQVHVLAHQYGLACIKHAVS